METIFERVGALDVHKAQVTACVRVPGPDGRRPELAEFSTTVPGLLALRDWLACHKVTHVAMKATGVYWQPVWHILEGDFELTLCNARHVKQVPGRKTDVSDAQWLAQLMEAGLLRGSFVPPKPQRQLRTYTRYRRARSPSVNARPTGCTKPWRTPTSSSTASPATSWASQDGRCSMRSSSEQPSRRWSTITTVRMTGAAADRRRTSREVLPVGATRTIGSPHRRRLSVSGMSPAG